MVTERPNVLVVAGYDQSAGAGVLSDVKTLEAHGVYGYAVCTGFTWQNEREISRIQWFTEKEIFEQIDLCYASAVFDWVKIGITRSMENAGNIIRHLQQHNPEVKVVLDPVIKASSGHTFWEVGEHWEDVAALCYLLTPNWEEIGWLYPDENIQKRCESLTRQKGRHIYLKGGHHPENVGRDYLWSCGEVQVLEPAAAETRAAGDGSGQADNGESAGQAEVRVYPKHGSGCVLSTSLAANLSLGYALPMAAVRSKRYIGEFLTSNKTLLGWHQPLKSRKL